MRTMLLVALTVAGCGYKKEIAALEVELAAVREAVGDRDKTVVERDAALADLEKERDELQRSLDDAAALRASLEQQLDGEREKSARILADRGSLRDEIEAMKGAMEELAERKRQADARVSAYRDLVDRFRSLIDAGTLDVKIIDGRMVVILKTDILFGSGSATLSQDGKDALTAVAMVLQEIPDRRFQIEGHTDDVPIATSRYPSNWYLASARAIGVTSHLIAVGMDAERISAASFGEMHPIAPNRTDEGRALNRRIEIVVVPDLSELPGYEELGEIE